MKRTLYIAGGFTLAFLMPFNLQAQNTQPKDTTMNRTVVVEQEYNPDILDASKVNVLPKVEEPTVSKKEVEYATTFFPATSIPADLMRPYVGTEVQPGSKPGYIRAGYGNYGNLDLLANYLFRLSDRDKLNVRFQMDGMDGKLTDSELGAMAEALAGAQYSQKQEYEADAYGVEFCVKNNIDPYGMYKSLNKLLELSNGAPASSYMQRMFSSHPDTAKRVARAKELADKYKQ